jgi:hypothetical protein
MERVSDKPGRNPGWTEAAHDGSLETADVPDLYRRLYERAIADRDQALVDARVFEGAWQASVSRCTALEDALLRLLDETRQRRGYSPRVFVARLRAKASLRGVEPLD